MKDLGKISILALAVMFLYGIHASADIAVLPVADYIAGTATIGGTAAPDGTAVKVIIASTGEIVGTTVVNSTQTGSAGGFQLQVEFCDPDDTTNCVEGNSTDGKATTASNVIFKVANDQANVTGHTGKTSSGGGGYTTGVALAIGAGCGDGIMNGDETGVDCGGTSCTACYALTAALSSSNLAVPGNSSNTTILTITNTGKENLAGITVTLPSFSPAVGSVTLTKSTHGSTLAGSGTGSSAGTKNINVTINATVAVNTTEAIYTSTVNVSATNVSAQQKTLSINTVAAGDVVKKSKRMVL